MKRNNNTSIILFLLLNGYKFTDLHLEATQCKSSNQYQESQIKRKNYNEADKIDLLIEELVGNLPKKSKIQRVDPLEEARSIAENEADNSGFHEQIIQAIMPEEIYREIDKRSFLLHDPMSNSYFVLKHIKFDNHNTNEDTDTSQNHKYEDLRIYGSVCFNSTNKEARSTNEDFETDSLHESLWNEESVQKKNIYDKIFLLPYRRINIQHDKIRKEYSIQKYSDFYLLYYDIQRDYAIRLPHLVNIINRRCKIAHYDVSCFCAKAILSYKEFYEILSYSYEFVSIEFDYELGLEKLFDEFKQFEKYVEEEYKITVIRDKYIKDYKQFGEFIQTKNKFTSDCNHDVINFHINILKGDNYKLLLSILPLFHIIFRKNNFPMQKKFAVKIIRYLQLIICKFEVFRHFYFSKKYINEENLQNLHYDEKFNETVAIISKILTNIIVNCCFEAHNMFDILKILDFLYFVRAKYNSIFQQFISDKILSGIYFFEEEVIKIEFLNCGNLKTFEFQEKFAGTALCKRLKEIMSKN